MLGYSTSHKFSEQSELSLPNSDGGNHVPKPLLAPALV